MSGCDPGSSGPPRVTIGIATLNRDTYLEAAIRSCLDQDYDSFEVLVVLDGTTNPETFALLSRLKGNPRLRVVSHGVNRGIAAAYNTFISEGRGELIAMLGDDDLCLPGRLRRQCAVFDRHPDTGVVHGDATVIDAAGHRTGDWCSADAGRGRMFASLIRSHNHLVDPTRMVHRRVYEELGGYSDRYPLANDFDFWLRAAPRFRFRHVAGGPLSAVRRHGANTSDERRARRQEVADVEGALRVAFDRHSLRELVPELDWAVLEPSAGERQALLRLAALLESRLLPLPGLAGELRQRAAAAPARSPVPRQVTRRGPEPKRILMTSFGWNDSGGGTTVPRLVAKELARRGHQVMVFHAAVALTGTGIPYETREFDEDGVHLVAVHNRPHGLFDVGNPWRELEDPPITAQFERALDRFRPEVVHFHALQNLGAGLIDRVAARGVLSFFTPHNYWLVCPRGYLMDGTGAICPGPADGARCASCVGSSDAEAHQSRLAEIRGHAERGLTGILAVSEAVRAGLLNCGYSPELVSTVRQSMPHDEDIWRRVGAARRPGRRRPPELTVAFLGSAYPHKGPQDLIEAAQRTQAEIKVRILGEVPARFAAHLRELDRRGVAELEGAFSPSEIGELLADVDAVALPSRWWDCAPLAAAECLAARVPLIVPRLGGVPESIRDGVDGLLFDALSVPDLTRQLDRLASEPGLLERLQGAIEPPRSFAAYVDELEGRYGGAALETRSSVKRPVQVRWVGDHGLATSLSIINDQVSARLRAQVQHLSPRVGAPGLDPPLAHPAEIEIRHSWPPDLRPAPAGRLAVILPWEFGAVPLEWTAQIAAHVDELWVPSEYVRRMYLDAGIAPERVVSIPNGVDPELFSPRDEARTAPGPFRFLFVGGLIWRKGPDVLLEAWKRAFPDRDDVTLVLKDFGADGVYRGANRGAFEAHAASGALPRIELVQAELSPQALADLYRSCDVLVHPYRGEGFGMPVLEAMACGLPVIITAGGPTDEFCPPEAGWRVRSRISQFPQARVDSLATAGRPWVLEPDLDHLVERLQAAAAAPAAELAARGQAGRQAAQRLAWDSVAGRYQDRIDALLSRPPRSGRSGAEPADLSGEATFRLLATPAWRGADRLGELLSDWARATTPQTGACLHLLADPMVDGEPAELEAHVLAAAAEASVDLDACADVDVLMQSAAGVRAAGVHAAVDAYVALHVACAGHERLARATGRPVFRPGDGRLVELLLGAAPALIAAGR